MTGRRRHPKEPGPTEPKNGDRGSGVVLEDIRGQMKVVLEALQGTATSRELRDLAIRTENIGNRVDLLSDALRLTRAEVAARFDGVDQRFDGVDKRFDGVEQELRAVRQDVARQAQGSELKALEQRMTVVERHLGL